MSTSEEELNLLDNELNTYQANLNKIDMTDAEINAQISVLRLQLAKLRDDRAEVNTKIREAKKKRESVQRKVELEMEARLIEDTLVKRREEAKAILAEAPWKDQAFSWQIDGAIQLPDRALLGDKRGMGKTFSAIIWRRLKKANRTLICLRKEVASDFIKELGIREPGLFVYNLVGANAIQRKVAATLLKDHENFVVVINIESWRRSVETTIEEIMQIPYDTLILDEAHHIKNSNTGTAQGFFRLANRIPKILEMTGTPIKNRPQEMFSLLHALYPQLFPTERKFLVDYCTMMGPNKWVFTRLGLVALVEKISAFYIARTPNDIGREVPPPKIIEYKLDFENHPRQKQAYIDMTDRSLAILNSGKVIPIVSQLAIMTRQAQVLSWPSGIRFEVEDEFGGTEVVQFDVEESVKADWAVDLSKELIEEGERIILFSRFKPVIYELKKRLEVEGLRVAVITGDENSKRNRDIFDDFDLKTADPENYKYDILLATYQTVGESANFNAAKHMILFDRFWNPGNEDQAIGRIDRINSVDQATVHVPLVENSFDDYMSLLIDEKRNIVADFGDAAQQQARLTEYLEKTI